MLCNPSDVASRWEILPHVPSEISKAPMLGFLHLNLSILYAPSPVAFANMAGCQFPSSTFNQRKIKPSPFQVEK